MIKIIWAKDGKVELTEDELNEIIKDAKAEGYNLGYNCGKAMGQSQLAEDWISCPITSSIITDPPKFGESPKIGENPIIYLNNEGK